MNFSSALRLRGLTALVATMAIAGCSSTADDGEASETTTEGLAAAAYFKTAGEAVVVTSSKLTPGTLTIAQVNTFKGTDPQSCARSVRIGTCLVQNCVVPTAPPAPSAPINPVTITSGATTINLSAASPIFFDFKPAPLPALIAAGDEVRAAAGGVDRVPAFTLTTKMPTAAVITSPDYAQRVTIRRSAPFIPTWTGADKLVSVRIAATEMAVVVDPDGRRGGRQIGASSTVECMFPGPFGRGVVPAAALANLPIAQGAPESIPLTAPAGTPYTNVNLEISSESHALKLSADGQGPALGELIAVSANDNTSDVDIVQ